MANPLDIPLIWGLIGGAGYSGTRLATSLWSGIEVTPESRKLAIAQFLVSILLAPFAAEAITPLVIANYDALTMPPVAFMIGLSFNAVWPMLVERGFLRTVIADTMRGLAGRISPGDKA